MVDLGLPANLSPTGSPPSRTNLAARGGGLVVRREGQRLTRSRRPSSRLAHGVAPDGVYLITGGASGVGAALARDLADRGRPTLVLAGRSPVHRPGCSPTCVDAGATVDYHAVDVGRRTSTRCWAGSPAWTGCSTPPVRSVPARWKVGPAGGDRRGHGRQRRAAATCWPRVCAATSAHADGVRGVLVGVPPCCRAWPGLSATHAAANALPRRRCARPNAPPGMPWIAVNFAAFAEVGLAASAGVTQGRARPLGGPGRSCAARPGRGRGGASADLAVVWQKAAGTPAVMCGGREAAGRRRAQAGRDQ